MLTRVIAQKDLGSMSELTRWKPRRVLCISSLEATEPSVEHVVKYRQQGRIGVCALISEVIGGLLLQAAGLPVVEPRLVIVTEEFARECNSRGDIPYHVESGTHFGTPYIRGENGPVLKLVRLARPQQVIDL